MEFRFQDILKNIIPGSIFAIITITFLGNFTKESLEAFISSGIKEYSEIVLVALLTIFYLVGYILDAFASVCEFYLVHEIIGRPSYKLLTGKGSRIKMVNYKTVIDTIKNKCVDAKDLNFINKVECDRTVAADLFKFANNLRPIKQEKDSLLTEYYNSYVFARNLFWSTSLSSILFSIQFWSLMSFTYCLILLAILIVLYIRRRDRDYYYVREVLLHSMH